MMLIFILAAILICLLDGMPLAKKKQWKEFIVFGILMGISLLLAIGYAYDLPTPLGLLDKLLQPVGKTIFRH